jgi:hypothetical protein
MTTKTKPKPKRPAPKPQGNAVIETPQSIDSRVLLPTGVSPPQAVNRKEVEAAILESIDQNSDLRPMQRRRLEGIFRDGRRPRLKENIVDNVLHEMETSGELEEAPDGTLMARDWAAFFELVMKYLPAILKLFGL